MPSPNFALHLSSRVMLLLALTFLAAYAALPAHAQYVESVPYTFAGGADGASPAGSLIFDSKGNLYGTTSNGGNTSGSNCPGQNPPTGCGVVFELTPPSGGTGPWTESVLYTFQGGSDGAYPQSSLIFDSKGNLYGTTSNGGNMSAACNALGGCGTVFELSPPSGGTGPWTETVLYTFCALKDCKDGSFPYSSLIFDSNGNLYGTTSGGGTAFNGTVFELSPPAGGHGAWTDTPLYSFAGGSDGASPLANVIFDASGNLYGTTYTGAHGFGVVFELSPPSGGSGSWTEDVLYVFTGHADGSFPFAGLTFDTNGNLYGTTATGGLTSGPTCKKTVGCGVVFELSPGGGGSWTETPIYTFTAGTDGGYPYAGVIFNKGNLFGTTAQGGDISGANCSASVGCGVVFELTPPPGGAGPWNEIVQYTFIGGSDGAFPHAAPLFDALENLFGTASFGGDSSDSNCVDAGGCGVVFELTSEVAPVVKLSPSSLTFANQVVDTTSAPKTVTVTNVGSATLDFTSITASGDFAIASKTCGATLAVGASCKVKVTFTPTQLGARTGALTFTDNAPNSPQQVPLSGTGVSEVTLTPASYTYKKTKVGTTSAAKKFTLTNNQTVTLTSIVISTTGDFAVQSTTCGSTLAAKAKCTISVTFTPTQTGTRTGQLSVSDNAPGSPQTASLTGTGT